MMRPTTASRRRRHHGHQAPSAPHSSAQYITPWASSEFEPQDLRVSEKKLLLPVMEKTNGCENSESPIALPVSNHSDVAQEKSEKPTPKQNMSDRNKVSKSAAASSKGNRVRRKRPLDQTNSICSSPATIEKKTVKNITTPLPKVLKTEAKSSNAQAAPAAIPTPASKKQLPPPMLSPQVTTSSSDSHDITIIRQKKKKRSSQHSLLGSSPPLLILQKRTSKKPVTAVPSVASSSDSDLSPSSPRASKRIRLQHQPFQSPPPPAIIPAILRQPIIKGPEDKICVFQKGEFLAVRNENGSFFVCRTAQNVYKCSKRFKIQWMSDQDPDLYIPDFYDQTDFECVLTNLRMKRVDKNKFQLPSEERQRTLNILQRALNVENGIDISKFQVSTDGVDVSIVGKEDELLRLQEQHLLTEKKSPREALARNRGRPKQPPVKTSPRLASSNSPPITVQKKVKPLAATVKLRSREAVKVRLKKEGGKIIVSNKAQKSSVPKVKKIVERLHPNSKVPVHEKDPTFEMSVSIPYVSSSAHSKLLVRAIQLKDIDMLLSFMKDTQHICSLNCSRSVNIKRTPLGYAVMQEDHRAIKALLSAEKKKYANPPETLLEYQANRRPNDTMLGFAVKSVQMSRGGKEGNNAFLKDLDSCDATYPSIDNTLLKEALQVGVSLETLNILYSEREQHCGSWQKDEVLQHIAVAVRNGHHALAGQLVAEATDRGGYGFGNLHKEVLVNEQQQLSKFKTVSVTKKAIGRSNGRITPLHCAAINPNPQYLAALLAVCPEYTLCDDNGWRPIHYAAASQSTGSLELLFARNIPIEDVESEGNTCLHIAASCGRAHNVDLILRHLKATDSLKKEGSVDASSNDQFNISMIDRGNKKSFSPLHLACQNGHADVVRVLLRHKANIDKQTNAQYEKYTPLILASQQGHLDTVRVLIENTAHVELKDKKQRTALTHAIINGHAHVSSYLLHLGANPNTTDSSGNTLVHYAAAYGWYFCLKLLVEAGASLNLPNDWKITPLSLAFMKGHMGLVDFLVEQPGIDINVDVHNDNGMTLVMQALRARVNHSMLERIHFLVIKQNSDCTKIDFLGNNAMHHLVMAEVAEIIREKEMENVLNERKDINSTDEESEDSEDGPNKTHPSCSFNEEAQVEHDSLIQEIAKLLLDHGCDPMVKNKEGESPFTIAVKEGCLLLMKMFLDAGCKLSLESSSTGDNILHYLVSHACNRKVEPMLQAILNAKCSEESSTPHQLLCEMAKVYNKKGHTPLLQALEALKGCWDEERKNRLLSFSKFLIDELGADVAAPCYDADGKTLCYSLHLAAMCNGGSVTEILLAHKAPLNSLNSEGRTSLIVAINQENVEAIEALIRAGAVVNTKSVKDGNLTPLLLASKSPKLGKVVQFLAHNRADVNEVDPKNKNSALHYVVNLRAPDILETTKALLTAGANVNAENDMKRTPLHLSVNASSSDSDASYAVEECLLGFGAEVDALDSRGRMPLRYAFTKIGRHTKKKAIDPMELVVLLVDAMSPATIETADQFGQTLLHAAAYRGATISSMHIAKKMKNLDVKDKNGNTALGYAVNNGHESCTLMLLQRGASCIADFSVVDSAYTNNKNDKDVYWKWKHTVQEPPQPKRHSVLQETLLQDWQGILYLMLDQLEAMGKGINVAVEAALRTAKYNVALKLIGKVKHGWTLYTEKQSMLHVLAREAPGSYLPDLQIKVAQFLIEKTVPVMARDEHGCSALTYAAINWNYALCSFFCSKMGITAAAQVDADRSARTPLSAIFWNLTQEDLPEEMRAWCVQLVKSGGTVNILCRYPITDSSYPGVPYSPVTNTLYIEDPSHMKITPLILAIRKLNYAVVKFLLNQGADVNLSDEQKRTPLMHAVRMNDVRMVKLLLNSSYEPQKDKSPYRETEVGAFQKTSALSLTEKDGNGWTVVHHIACPLVDYCYSDHSVLYLLAEFGAPLDTLNKDNESPLTMALRLKHASLVTVLQDLLNIPISSRLQPSVDELPPKSLEKEEPGYDYKVDSEKVLSKFAESSSIEPDQVYLPDSRSSMLTNGDIVIDDEKKLPYDVLMTVVDLNYGAYGIYNFYKMQIIKHKVKELFVLFTCWGRVGDDGDHQKTPFGNMNDAVKEFCRIFKAKSGNTWEDMSNFQPQSKKYRLVQLDKRKHILRKCNPKLALDFTANSKLNLQLQELLKTLMNVHIFEGSLANLGINAEFEVLPFGKISEDTLSKAVELLQEIGGVISDRENLQLTAKSTDKLSDLTHKIVKLSEEFYQLLPIYGYQYEKLCPLFYASDVHSKLQLIDNLQHIGLAGRMLLAAHSRVPDVNPIDYIYKSLGCQLQQLDQETQEAQMILQYIHNTSLDHKVHVESIYVIDAPNLTNNHKEETSTPKKYLLWHGTRLSNIFSILNRGLKPSPLGVSISGNLFGKGIYFADTFAKSLNYCHEDYSAKTRCMFLCEVELSGMKEVNSGSIIDFQEKCDCVKALGRQQPNPASCVSWKGIAVPLGSPINALEQGISSHHHFLNFNEYVVYNSSRVSLKYLIQFRC